MPKSVRGMPKGSLRWIQRYRDVVVSMVVCSRETLINKPYHHNFSRLMPNHCHYHHPHKQHGQEPNNKDTDSNSIGDRIVVDISHRSCLEGMVILTITSRTILINSLSCNSSTMVGVEAEVDVVVTMVVKKVLEEVSNTKGAMQPLTL